MRFFVISDNSDTLTGLRLAGIDGTRVSSAEDVKEAVSKVIANPDIGVLLITEKLARATPDLIYDLKLKLTHT
ncbi:MAG: V-type ATP synthase subunit F, partial [Oscillospiraceae bacterium]|nr:V-type ATP synthase subunit F [Oscillospiraceae bacterium]